MPIDSSILRSVRTPKLPNPVEQFTTGLQLRNLLLGNQAQEMEMQSAQAQQAMESRIREILGKHGGDFKKAAPEITALNPSLGMAIAKYEQEFSKSQADIAQSQAATESSRATTRKTGEELAQARDKAKRGYFSELPRIPESGRFAVYQSRRPSALRSEYFTPDELPEDEPGLRARFGDDWATALAGGPDVPLMQEQRLQTQAQRGEVVDEFTNKAGRRVFALRGADGKITYEEGPEVERAATAPRTVTTEQGVFILGPDGALGNRLGDRPRPTSNADTLSPYAESNILNRLSQQWDKATADVKTLSRANAIMQEGLNAARRGDMNAGSQAVLITFQKFLDPDSVVRESEYARSAAGLSVTERVKGAVERLTSGGAGVTLPELESFAALARDINNNLAKEGSSLLAKQQERIGRSADRYKIPRDLVFSGYDYTIQSPSTKGPDVQTRTPAPTATRGSIRVISPTGESGSIPLEDWPQAQKEGYRRID